MKKLIFAISLLISIIILGTGSLFYLNKTKNEIKLKLEEITTLVKNENYTLAAEKADSLYHIFEKRTDCLVLFVKHDSIEELEETLLRLSPLISNKDSSEFLAEVSKAEGLSEKLFEHEIPSLKNIF